MLITQSRCTFKLSNPGIYVRFSTSIHVNTFKNDHLHPDPDNGMDFLLSFLLSSSARLGQYVLDVSPWLTHKFAPLCHTQVHDVTVFDKHHFDHCWFYQWCTPTVLIEDTILNFGLMCACPVGIYFYLVCTRLQQLLVQLWSLRPTVKAHKAASPFCQNLVLWCSQDFSSELHSSEQVTLGATPLHGQYQDFDPVSDPAALVSYCLIPPWPVAM